MKQAGALIEGFEADYVIADKGYDKHLYKESNLVERVFQKLKHYRRIATRYERWGVTYLAMLGLVATVIWLN